MPEVRRRSTSGAPLDIDGAVEVAARYLATRPRSRWEVERRLLRAGADPAVIDAALTRLEALGLVDDAQFARWWAQQRDRHSPRGRRMVEAELRQRGVVREAIEGLREAWDGAGRHAGDDELPTTDQERAAAALERHLRGRPLPDDAKALQRLGMYLVRRGFDPETTRAAVRRVQHQGGAADDDDAP
ncbi:MAG TPA: regulatory protein RecX [Candidatus Limnocylindria bacterium]|nr:regulatory protein RecX [Candidatus Limnocylindria bacterium]